MPAAVADTIETSAEINDLLTSPDKNTWAGISVWVPPPGRSMGKRLTFSDDGNLISKSGQKTPPKKWLRALSVEAPDFESLMRVVEYCDEHNAVLVHGGLTEAPKREWLQKIGVKRHGANGNVTDRPTRILLLDLDNLPPWPGVRELSAPAIHEIVAPLLPVEFRNAQCLLHYSTGHGADPNTIKVHLVYILSRPLDTAERKSLLAEVLTFKTGSGAAYRPVDGMPLGEAHFVNITPPETINAPEGYAKQRWFWIDSGSELVRVPESGELKRRASEGAKFKMAHGGAVSGRSGRSSGLGLGERPVGVTDWAELIWAGVGDGRTGHTAMRHGAFSYFGMFGASAPREPFMAVFAEAIDSLNLDPAEADRILADEGRHFDWIQGTIRAQDEPETVSIDCPATLTQEQGRAQCRAAIRSWMAGALRHKRSYGRWSRGRQIVNALQAECEGVASGAERSRLYAAAGEIGAAAGVTKYADGDGGLWGFADAPAPAPAMVIQGSVALGKTESIIDCLAGARRWGLRVVLAVADHDLLGDIRARIEQRFEAIGGNPEHRPRVAVWRGESAVDVGESTPENKIQVCRRATDRGVARAIGAAPERLCKRGRGRKATFCPHHPENPARVGPGCLFIRQQTTVANADIILIAGSACLERRPNDWISRPAEEVVVEGVEIKIQLPRVDLVILDEPRWAQLISGVDLVDPDDAAAPSSKLELRVDELPGLWDPDQMPQEVADRIGDPTSEAAMAWENLRAAVGRLAGVVESAPLGQRLTYGQLAEIVGDVGLLGEARAAELSKIAYKMLAAVSVDPTTGPDEWLGADSPLIRRWNERLIFCARAFAAAQRAAARHNGAAGECQTGYLRVAEIGKRGARGRGLLIRAAARVHRDWREGAGLILDATHESIVADEFWPNLPAARVIEVAQPKNAAYVRQIMDESWSLTKVEELIKSPAQVARLADFIEIEAAIVRGRGEDGIDLLVLLPLRLKGPLMRHWRQRPPEGVDFATWGSVRGQDRWRGVAGLLAISRILPPAETLSDLESIIAGQPSILDERAFRMAPAQWRQNANRGKAWQLPNKNAVLLSPIAEALRRMACDSELQQGIGRARTNIRPDAKVRITVLATTPVPGLCVDALVTGAELFGAHPAALAAARGFIAPAAGKGSRALMAKILKLEVRAWEKEIERKGEMLRPDISLYHIYYKEMSGLRNSTKIELIGSGTPEFEAIAAAATWLPVQLKLKRHDRYATRLFLRAQNLEMARELCTRVLGAAPALLEYWDPEK